MTTLKTPRRMARPPYEPAASHEAGSEPSEQPMEQTAEKRVTKQSQVIDLLRAEGGATLTAIVAATGWQAHTTRAALTGLRKKGHAVERASIEGATVYRIVAATAQ